MGGRSSRDSGLSLAGLGSSLERHGQGVLYAVLGEEDCLRDHAIDMIRNAASPRAGAGVPGDVPAAAGADANTAFSFEVLYGDEASAEEIVCHAREVSFFSSHRVMLLKWADKLSVREGEALMPYFAAPSDSTTLIISAGKLDGRLKWVQACTKRAVVVNCAPLYDSQRPDWIRQEASRLGLSLDAEAEMMLSNTGREGLYRVRRELEKLALYVSRGTTVTARDVVAVQGKEPGASIFDLSGAIAQGNEARALLILDKNLKADELPLRILGALLWQYRRLWKANDGLSRGVGEAAVARSLGIHPRGQHEFFAVARRMPLAHFPKIFAAFAETDRALKGGAANSPHRIMHALIFGLCQLAKSAPDRTRRPAPQVRRQGTGRNR
ncbi:MAG: DNA polymerase III subunit delta [Nitrospira sp.]|nr:DNA polymerase III subunit delta [Nitrospira sp.]